MKRAEYIDLTEEIVAKLQSHKKRTGVGPSALLRGLRHEMPEGLNGGLVSGWLGKKIKTARPTHLTYVLELWEKLPDWDELYIPLSEKIIKELRNHNERTGVSPNVLLKGRDDVPKGLTPGMIVSWYYERHNTPQHVLRNHLEYVLKIWEKVPDNETIEISPEWREEVTQQQKRTGITPGNLIKIMNARENLQNDLTSTQVYGWYRDRVKTAPASLLKLVLETYRALPDYSSESAINTFGNQLPIKTQMLADISPDDLERLLHYRDKTGILPSLIFKDAHDVPLGLTPRIISSWLTGNTMRANPEYIQYVLKRCRQLLEEALDN